MWFNILRQVHGYPPVPNRSIPPRREYMTPHEWLHAHSANWWVLLLFGMVVCCNLITLSIASWLDNQNDKALEDFACRSYHSQRALAGDGIRALKDILVQQRISMGEDPDSAEIQRLNTLARLTVERIEVLATERLGTLPPGCELKDK